ncbi:hypothetical protein [Yoonia sp. SS1-5]|uniref:Uncharacterized protein n=1 Tax=Yoonia rhodophyticola TaxID=3137370 RepID=A0AAN0MDX2_9RHOB
MEVDTMEIGGNGNQPKASPAGANNDADPNKEGFDTEGALQAISFVVIKDEMSEVMKEFNDGE